MELHEDADTYDGWQAWFSLELLRTIRDELDRAGVPPSHLRSVTTRVGFAVSTLLDASTPFVVDGAVVTPVLTFSAADSDVLVHQGGPSSLHDYAFGNTSELFKG
jgi:hypothetical protein